MTSRPAPVVLDDLACPRFSPEIDQLRATLADVAPGCPLEPDALCAAAVEQAGADDFGDDAFRPRLDLLCAVLRRRPISAPRESSVGTANCSSSSRTGSSSKPC